MLDLGFFAGWPELGAVWIAAVLWWDSLPFT